MERLRSWWRKTPTAIRKPIVLTVGLFFVIASALTGWLPGPGGIPLFLIGVAILATEYAWARRLRDSVLQIIHGFSRWYRRHKIAGTILVGVSILSVILFGWLLWVFIW